MSNHRKPFPNVATLVLFVLGLVVWPQALVAQQWDGSSVTTGTIYRDGEIQGRGPQGGIFRAISPNNPDAFVMMSWLEDVARIRVGGSGVGAANGLDIQRIGNVSLLRIKDNGRVGIGTTDPKSKLHIAGDLQVDVGEGFQLLGEDNYWGTYKDARIFRMIDKSSGSSGGWVDGGIVFERYTASDSVSKEVMVLRGTNGRVGIGVHEPSHKLDVAGTVRASEVIVESTGADFVFDEGYDLPTLEEVAAHIAQHGHLPEIPSAAEMQAEGVSLAALTTTLLQKIEELTLYAIEQHEYIAEQRAQNTALLDHLAQLEVRLQALEQQ